MPFSSYFSSQQRPNGYPEKTRLSNGLPTYSSAVQEKLNRRGRSMSWVVPVTVPIPGVHSRRLRLFMPNPGRVYHLSVLRFVRKRGPMILCFLLVVSVFAVFSFARRFGPEEKQWTPNFGEPSTLVFGREDLQRIWKWEIASSHYPSKRESKPCPSLVLAFQLTRHKVPEQIGLTEPPLNPALPPRKAPSLPSRFRPPPGPVSTTTRGDGPRRVYLDIQSQPPNVAYPPRPVPGSVADLDTVMDHCDFSQNKVGLTYKQYLHLELIVDSMYATASKYYESVLALTTEIVCGEGKWTTGNISTWNKTVKTSPNQPTCPLVM